MSDEACEETASRPLQVLTAALCVHDEVETIRKELHRNLFTVTSRTLQEQGYTARHNQLVRSSARRDGRIHYESLSCTGGGCPHDDGAHISGTASSLTAANEGQQNRRLHERFAGRWEQGEAVVNQRDWATWDEQNLDGFTSGKRFSLDALNHVYWRSEPRQGFAKISESWQHHGR